MHNAGRELRRHRGAIADRMRAHRHRAARKSKRAARATSVQDMPPVQVTSRAAGGPLPQERIAQHGDARSRSPTCRAGRTQGQASPGAPSLRTRRERAPTTLTRSRLPQLKPWVLATRRPDSQLPPPPVSPPVAPSATIPPRRPHLSLTAPARASASSSTRQTRSSPGTAPRSWRCMRPRTSRALRPAC